LALNFADNDYKTTDKRKIGVKSDALSCETRDLGGGVRISELTFDSPFGHRLSALVVADRYVTFKVKILACTIIQYQIKAITPK
jgi:hypothetical protein